MPRRNRREFSERHPEAYAPHPARRREDPKPDTFTPRTARQKVAWTRLRDCSLVFLLGPAGTGKTLLAAARAAEDYLAHGRRIVAARPVVEAGESIGYLKGGLEEKMGPWLRPVTECLNMRLGADADLSDVFEMTSFTYLRGRTFDDATLILDEVQNASPAQLKLALTRAGERCRVIVTGDPDQCDLEPGLPSAADDLDRFRGMPDVGFIEFSTADVCRSDLVRLVLEAYDR